jgi:hypothetical protein
MAGVAADVKMGVCTVSFGGVDLGYTSGGVKVSYRAETKDVVVDQEDIPLDVIVTGQSIEVTIPLAEQNLERLGGLLPGATFTQDVAKQKLVLSGTAGTRLYPLGKKLVITPVGLTSANEKLTIYKAVPQPQIEFSYDKDKQRIYEVVFKGVKSPNGFVTFGDETAGT